jgi:multiple sugar transport system substrate-binding protein
MTRLSRRKFLKYAGIGVASAAAGVAGYSYLAHPFSKNVTSETSYTPPANATPDYAEFMKWLASVSGPYSGQTLDISLEYEFSPLALQLLDLDFLNATQISDQYDLKPYSLHLADVLEMVQTKAPTYDIISTDYQDIGSFHQYVLSPTQLAEKYPDLTYSNFSPNDFLSVPWSLCASYPSAPYQSTSSTATSENIVLIPTNMATSIQFYREDLYQASGLSPATTWDEYLSDANTLTGSKAKFGTVNESSPDVAIVYEYLHFLSSYGGSLWNVEGGNISTGLGSDAAESALEMYLSLKPYSDPASYVYTWDAMATDLLRGIGATALEFQEYGPWMDDPTRSLVVGDMGYSTIPAGPNGSFSTYGGDGIGISIYSKHPEAAWLWLQWATSLGTQEMALLGQYHAYPSRTAVFNDSMVQEALGTEPYRAVNVTKQVWDSGNIAALLPFPQWLNSLDIISNNLHDAWLGTISPSQALSASVQGVGALGPLTF